MLASGGLGPLLPSSDAAVLLGDTPAAKAAFADAWLEAKGRAEGGPWLFYPLGGAAPRWETAWLRRLFEAVDVVEATGAPRDKVAALFEALDRPEDVIFLLNAHEDDVMAALRDDSRRGYDRSRFYAACRRKRVGVVAIDEAHGGWTHANPRLRDHLAFTLRIGFGKFYDPDEVAGLRADPAVLVAPLGPAMFDGVLGGDLRLTPGILDRRFVWGFLGRAQSPARAHMLASFLAASDRLQSRNRSAAYALHITAGVDEARARTWGRGHAWEVAPEDSSWNAGLRTALPPARYRAALESVVFAPSPPGNVHAECYRTYEALEAGAIPVVSTRYYDVWFDAPFPIVDGEWSRASLAPVFALLDDPDALQDLADACAAWWRGVKADFPERFRALAAGEPPPVSSAAAAGEERCGLDRMLALSIHYNGMDYETRFPAVGDAATLWSYGDAFRRELDLRYGLGCEDAACITAKLVEDMVARIERYCQPSLGARADAAAESTGKRFEWVVVVEDGEDAADIPAASAPVRVAAVPGSGGDVVRTRLNDGAAPLTYFPFEADRVAPRRGTVVLHVLRNPVPNYCAWRELHPSLDLGLLAFTHRWLAHHEHWAARDDLTVVRVKYEHVLAGTVAPAAAALLRPDSEPVTDESPVAGCDYGTDDLAEIHRTLAPSLAAFGYALERRRDLPR